MFKRLILAFMLTISTVSCVGLPKEVIRQAHRSTYTLTFNKNHWRESRCSGTAIGHHAILTASHCEAGTEFVTLDGVATVHIDRVIHDNHDHSIFLISGAYLRDIAIISNEDMLMGDDVFYFGNPGDNTDLFRRGSVSGAREFDGLGMIILDVNGYFGDSGAAVFNDSGQIVTVISIVHTEKDDNNAFKYMGGFLLKFTPEQLSKAYKY